MLQIIFNYMIYSRKIVPALKEAKQAKKTHLPNKFFTLFPVRQSGFELLN